MELSRRAIWTHGSTTLNDFFYCLLMWLLTGSALLLLLSQHSSLQYCSSESSSYVHMSDACLPELGIVLLLWAINICQLRRRGSAGNVKTVKKQTFQKLSTKVPISNRNETITFEFVHEFVLSKELISIWSRGADSGPKRNNLFSMRQIRGRYPNVLVSFPKRYQNVCPFVFDADWESNSGLPYRPRAIAWSHAAPEPTKWYFNLSFL